MKLRKSVFLLDGIGAIVSFCLMFFMIAGFPEYFGLDPKIAYGLAIFPVFFGLYSFTCHFLKKGERQFPKLLKGIIIANICYCILTGLILILYFPKEGDVNRITLLGACYLIVEILVIVGVVYFEFLALRSLKKMI